MANPIQRTAQLTPVARPVDTFVQPPKSPLREAAASLGQFSASLNGLLEQRAVEDAQKEKTEATVAALTGADPKVQAAGVSKGIIPAQRSPNWMRTYNETKGGLASGSLQAKYQEAWNSWAEKDTDDPEAYDKFVQDFLKENLDPASNQDFLRGALPGINQLVNNGRSQYIAYRNDVLQKRNIDNTVSLTATNIRNIFATGLKDGNGTDLSLVQKTTDEARAKFISMGGKVEDFDKAMLETMSALAIETGDEKLLSWFTHAPEGGIAPDTTPEGLRLKLSTQNTLDSVAASKMTKEAALEEKARKQRLQQAHTGLMDFLVKNRDAPVPEEILKAAEDNGDWEIRSKVANIRDSLDKGDSNPRAQQQVITDIMNNPNADPVQIVRRAMENGVFTSWDDATKAINFAQSFKDNGDKIKGVQSRRSYSTAIKTIQDRTTALNDLGQPIGGLSNDALEATYDFDRLLTTWLIDNPNATDLEVEKRINELQTSILGNIKDNSEDAIGSTKPAGDYTRDAELPFDNPNSSLQPTPASTQDLDNAEAGRDRAQTAPPRTAPGRVPQKNPSQAAGPTDAQVDKYLQSLTPEKRKAIEDTLKRKGGAMDLKGYGRAVLQANPKLTPISYNPNSPDEGQMDRRTSVGFTQQQAEGWIDTATSGDTSVEGGVATNLLSLVGRAESGGNYNAVFGDSNSQEDLGVKTVDDILAAQQWARQNGYESTAVGKYQLLYQTLNGLKAEGVVKGSEPFNKDTQDKLGMALLNRRGYNEFLNGSISKRQFALRLSQEWAALPNPETGASYYAGDGLNASRVKPSSVYASMGLSPQPLGLDEGDDHGLRFVHPEQRAGVKKVVSTAVAEAFQELGVENPTVLSGHRSADHPVERAKGLAGMDGGEHTKGNALDVSLKGLSEEQRAALVRRLMAKGIKRFITYSWSPDMLHIDTKDQLGDGQPYFMFNKSARNMGSAPAWFKALALGGDA